MSEFFALLLLPSEVRQMIYTECLVVGKVFPYTLSETYDERDCDYDDDLTSRELSNCDAPQVQLLRVCKTIHAEAEALLYKRNTFVLPVSDLTARFVKRSLHNNLRMAYIKSVEIEFTASDLTRDDREPVLDEHLQRIRDDMLFPDRPESEGPEEHFDGLHDAYKEALGSHVWPRKISYIIGFLKLETLTIDFGAAYCMLGCCDMRAVGIRAMDQGFVKGIPGTLKLLGLGESTAAARSIIKQWTSKRKSGACIDDEEGQMERIEMALRDNL